MSERQKTGHIIEVYEAKGPFGLFKGDLLDQVGEKSTGGFSSIEEVLLHEVVIVDGYREKGIRIKTKRVPVYHSI